MPMTGMCCGGGETEANTPVDPSSKSARRRRMEIHQFHFVPTDSALAPPIHGGKMKRRKISASCAAPPPPPVLKSCDRPEVEGEGLGRSETSSSLEPGEMAEVDQYPRFGVTSVCGRRRDMEDAVAIHPSFCGGNDFFGVYDGHGCSHVASICKDRMHEIVRDEYERRQRGSESTLSWERTMCESFSIMDKEAVAWGSGSRNNSCRCESNTSKSDTVGSTAVVAVVTPDTIVVSNCGDSRAVLCRNGEAIPLSQDHKVY